MVFKNIAEQTYVRRTQLKVSDVQVDSLLRKEPTVKNGNSKKNKMLLSKLDYKSNFSDVKSDWVSVEYDSVAYRSSDLELAENVVPKVLGMGARDAVYLLEQTGLRVNLTGSGKVVAQSFNPGNKVVKGTTISITLK